VGCAVEHEIRDGMAARIRKWNWNNPLTIEGLRISGVNDEFAVWRDIPERHVRSVEGESRMALAAQKNEPSGSLSAAGT
jgi:hypothetical protein